jgi:two-component sensor histidine kinase
MIAERTFPHAVESVGRARRYALDAVGDAPSEIVDSIAVMVSELATNSVRHAASPFTLTVDRGATRVRIAVADDGDTLPTLRTPEPREHSGRGLQIVRALADEWGVTENVGRPGKTVWFVLAFAPSTSRDSVASSASRPARSGGADRGPGGSVRPRSAAPGREPESRGPTSRASRPLKARR